jgi:ABC-2 type transport system permease protein
MKRTYHLLVKELTLVRRDPRLLGVLIAAPVFQLLIMGFACRTDVREIALGVRDNDHSWHSREYVRAVAASGHFKVIPMDGPATDDTHALIRGQINLLLVIPPDFDHRLLSRREAPVQVIADGTDSNFAVHGLNYLQKATRQYSEGIVRVEEDRLRRAGIALPSIRMETRAWFNPDLASAHYMVPALMGVLLLVTTMIVSSMALVKEREDGTIEQVIVTPLRPGELILGKLLPYVVVGFIELTMAMGVVRLVFGVPLRGHVVTLYVFSGLFLLTTLGMGLLISTLVRTQQQAMMAAGFFVTMPFVLLSGFIFPVENMPVFFQHLSAVIPLRYYIDTLRGLYLKGTGWAELWHNAACLAALGLTILSLAVLRFRKRLD